MEVPRARSRRPWPGGPEQVWRFMRQERHKSQWNAGWGVGHQDGLQDSRTGNPRLVAESRPQEDWHRGYLAGYHEGYDEGVKGGGKVDHVGGSAG